MAEANTRWRLICEKRKIYYFRLNQFYFLFCQKLGIFSFCVTEYQTLGPPDSLKELGPLGRALPHPRLGRPCKGSNQERFDIFMGKDPPRGIHEAKEQSKSRNEPRILRPGKRNMHTCGCRKKVT